MSGEGIVEGLGPLSASVSDALCSLSQLRDQTFAVLRDSERLFVTETEVDTWLNEAYLDINARLRLKQTTLDDTTETDGTIPYPTDFVEMISLWFENAVPAAVVDDTVFESYSEPGTTTFIDQVIVRAFGSNLETYPVQNAVDFTLRYVSRPTLMVLDDDQPTALTPELCVRLWKYAAAEAKRKEGEAQEAQTYMDEYLEGLPGRPRVQHRMRPAPVSLLPEPGPFG